MLTPKYYTINVFHKDEESLRITVNLINTEFSLYYIQREKI